MDFWDVLRAIHLLAMAFFVGGQIMLVAVLVPLFKGKPEMKLVARRFLHTSGAALILLILTGVYLAGHEGQWDNPTLWVKIGFLVAIFGLVGFHAKNPDKRWVDPILGVFSLVIVFLGVALSH
ncbi:MAG: hypothetical protein Q7T55_06965 [Solirubrobacteraceae bacterium]|nr:hypothetical protein [Solirubrobacteraceae bacterium]